MSTQLGSPEPAPRPPRVPIAYENRLVEPDRLGTTIKLANSASWMGPPAWRQRGWCYHLYIESALVTCPEIRCPRACGLADRLPLVTASQGRGGRLRNVSAAGVSQRSQARLPNMGSEQPCHWCGWPRADQPFLAVFDTPRDRPLSAPAARWRGGSGWPAWLKGFGRTGLRVRR
jgi:hypothetical protein